MSDVISRDSAHIIREHIGELTAESEFNITAYGREITHRIGMGKHDMVGLANSLKDESEIQDFLDSMDKFMNENSTKDISVEAFKSAVKDFGGENTNPRVRFHQTTLMRLMSSLMIS